MQQEPSRNLKKLAASLFSDLSEQDVFLGVLSQRGNAAPALAWLWKEYSSPFEALAEFPWQPDFVERIGNDLRPGKHPLHEEGAFYCLDMASVFMSMPFTDLPAEPLLIVDVCASPGGKSIMAWRVLRPKLLIANETIGKRTAALISNLQRCHIDPCVVTNTDPQYLGDALGKGADLVVVDAPCSGQSLLARGQKSASCFHPVTINKNAMRQRRILANAAGMVGPGGYLCYMTCTFSREENERVLEWFLKEHQEFEVCEVASLSGHESSLADFPCYRLWPQQGEGAGGFTSLLRNTAKGGSGVVDLSKIRVVWESGGSREG